MFGQNKLNLTKFNLAGTGKTIPFSRENAENINCVAGGRIYLYFTRAANENIRSKSNIIGLLPIARAPLEKFLGKFTLQKFMLISRNAQEEIYNYTDVTKIMFLLRDTAETIIGSAYAGKLMHGNARTIQERISQRTHAGKFIFTSRLNTEAFACNTSASLTQYTIANIDITIPPGGEIRINSDVFTALMGLDNILYAYNGDWVSLKRDTIQLIVDSGTGGNLTGEIIYNERYI